MDNYSNNISFNQINDIPILSVKDDIVNDLIAKINDCKDSLNLIWNSIKNEEISTINNSWLDEQSKEYVDRLLEEDKTINRIDSVLESLTNTYQKVINENIETGQNIKSIINRLS